VLVPKKLKLGRARKLALGVHAEQPGVLTLRLVRGGKTYSRRSTGVAAGDVKLGLRLPKRLKAGAYSVKIAFKPTGTSWSATGAAKVRMS
jgi:hypothetical protein